MPQYTKLLMHGDDASYVDSSYVTNMQPILGRKVISYFGNAAISTDQYKISPSSLYFDGSDSYLSIADSDDWHFADGDFTVDLWVKPENLASSTYRCMLGQREGTTSNHSWGLFFYGTTQIRWTMTYNGSSQVRVDFTLPSAVSNGTWYHVAVVRNGANLNCYLDGVACSLTYNISTNSIYNGTGVLRIGATDSGILSDYQGYIDELRISKGIARWTSGFTPSTTYYETDSYTKLLLHCHGDDGSVDIIDSSMLNISLGTKKFGDGSFHFLSGGAMASSFYYDFIFGTKSFTFEGWINFDALGSTETIFSVYDGGSGAYIKIFKDSSDYLNFGASTGSVVADYTSTSAFSATTWTHWAVVRNGTGTSCLKLYLDGVDVTPASPSTNLDTSEMPLIREGHYIGAFNGGDFFAGYMDELRISNGVARWTTGFTPETSAYSDFDTIQVASLNLQTEVIANDIEIASFNLQTEVTSNNIEVCSLNLQVEVIEGGELDPQGVLLEILEYQSTETAESGTSSSQIVITNHGLSAHDMIVNETRRTVDAERGARLVGSTGLTSSVIPLDNYITSQTDGDDIRLYKFTDRTGLIRIKTFRLIRRTGGKTEVSFTLVTDNSYIPRAGQYVRVSWDDGLGYERKFLGVIKSIKMVAVSEARDELFLTCQCVGLNQVPSRRTIQVAYTADGSTTYGDIVEDMVDDYLYQDGIRKGTVSTGEVLADDWIQDVVSISEVLDECAAKCGFQWFVDDEGLLQFYQDPASVTDAVEDILDVGTFTDFINLEFEESIDSYINKMFVAGGRDTLYDNDIVIGSEDFDESTAMQEITAGTGVYGNVLRDAGIVEANEAEAEVGTTTTNITITGHGQAVGYMIYNSDRGEYRQITAIVDANNFTVDAVTSQTNGDDIVFFDQANKLIANEFKLRGFVPKRFSFVTREMGFEPGTKIQVDLDRYGVSTEYYVIDDVEIWDEGGTVDTFKCRVTCSKRDNSNFSTQRLPNYFNFFGGF